MEKIDVMRNVLLDDGRHHAVVAAKVDLEMLADSITDENVRNTLSDALNEAFAGYGEIELGESYYCTEIIMHVTNGTYHADVIVLCGSEYIYVMDNGEFRATSAYATINGQVLAAAFKNKDNPINEEIEPELEKEEKEEKENEDMAAANTSATTTKSNIPAIPANFKFTKLENIKMTGMAAKAAVSVHAQLVARCADRESRLAQVQDALNVAFDGLAKKIELVVKESGDVKMRTVDLTGSVFTTILPCDTTFYIYADARTGRINVMQNLSQQWAELKQEFAAVGTPEYAYISPFAAGIVKAMEEPESEEIEEKENMDMEGKDAMIAALERKLAELEKKNSDLAHQVLDVEESNRKLAAQVELAEKENAELAECIEEMEVENAALRNDYAELVAMVEKIEKNAEKNESRTKEPINAQSQDEVIESSNDSNPISAMDKHADAIGADMSNISSRADDAKKNMGSIAKKAAAVQNETAEMMDKINAMKSNQPDADALRARIEAHLAAPIAVETDTPTMELSTEDIGKITDPIVMSGIGGYSFCIYIPSAMCKNAPAVNDAIDAALREYGFDPDEIKRGKQKKEYKYDGAFFYLYGDNPRMQIIPLYTDSKPLWRRAEMFRNAFSAQFHKWLTAHGMAA